MSRADFDAIRGIVYDMAGIRLSDEKQSFLYGRLHLRLRQLGCPDFGAYIGRLRGPAGAEELVQLIDLVTTNVTGFFRDAGHFRRVGEHLRVLRDAGQRRFRLWSAACATGEEPYTLAMVVDEILGASGFDTRILATDISSRALRACREAYYDPARLDGVPPGMRARGFEECEGDAGPCFRVRGPLRSLVSFARLNLSQPPFPMRGPFDAILCRNVMIYFDADVRQRLLLEVRRLLAPGGLLVLGASESLGVFDHGFERLAPSVYSQAGPPGTTP